MTALTVDKKEEPKEEKKPIDVPVTVELPKDSPLNRLVPPHDTKSRQVLEEDLNYISKEAKILYDICLWGAHAMHHSQIEADDPMDFFVTSDRTIIINPKIINHTQVTVDGIEGCVTFGGREWINVPRYNKIEVSYYTIMVDPLDSTKFKLSSLIIEDLSGKKARIFQHEINHGLSKYIYEK